MLATFNLQTPKFNDKDENIKDELQKIKSYIHNLNEQLRYNFSNIDSDNFTNGALDENDFPSGFRQKVKDMEGGFSSFIQTSKQISLEVGSNNIYRAPTQAALLLALSKRTPAITLVPNLVWYDTTAKLLKRCLSISPITWETLQTNELHTSFIDIAEESIDIGSGGNVNIDAGGAINLSSKNAIKIGVAGDGLGDLLTQEINDALADAIIEGLATGSTIFYQAGIPTSLAIGDMWYDTDEDPVKVYRAFKIGASIIAEGEWVDITTVALSKALSAAGTAQATADGKIKTWAQDAIPTAEGIGDLWIDTAHNNKLYSAAAAGATEIKTGGWVLYLVRSSSLETSYINIEDKKIEINSSGEVDILSGGKMNIASGGSFNLVAGSGSTFMLISNSDPNYRIVIGSETPAYAKFVVDKYGNVIATTLQVAAANITGTFGSTQIADGAVTTNKLGANSVTSAKIAANTIEAGDIKAGTITANEIESGTITSGLIKTNAITSEKLDTDLTIGTGKTLNIGGGVLNIASGSSFNLRAGSGGSNIGISNNEANQWFLWAGAAIPSAAPFRVKMDGSVYAKNIQQVYSQSFWDMSDNDVAAEFWVYIPTGYTVNSAEFSCMVSPCRTFAKSAAAGGGGTKTSKGGGGESLTSGENDKAYTATAGSNTNEVGSAGTGSPSKDYTDEKGVTTGPGGVVTTSESYALETGGITTATGTGYPSTDETSALPSNYDSGSGWASASVSDTGKRAPGTSWDNGRDYATHKHDVNDHSHTLPSGASSHYHTIGHKHTLSAHWHNITDHTHKSGSKHTHQGGSHTHSGTTTHSHSLSNHNHTFAHKHTVDDHQHGLNNHKHSVTVTSHTHEVDLDEHEHGIAFGVNVAPGSSLSGISTFLYVNGVSLGSYSSIPVIEVNNYLNPGWNSLRGWTTLPAKVSGFITVKLTAN